MKQIEQAKQKKAEGIAQQLINKLTKLTEAKQKVDKRALESRLETLLVEWGVPPSVVTKKPDYGGIARLVAAAAAPFLGVVPPLPFAAPPPPPAVAAVDLALDLAFALAGAEAAALAFFASRAAATVASAVDTGGAA